MKNKVKDLHHDYKKVYTKIARNLSSRHISNTVFRDILDDVLALALNNQQRDIPTEEAFGDLEEFCNQISENAVKETMLEHILRLLYIFSGAIFIFFIMILLLSLISLDDTTSISFTHYTFTFTVNDFCTALAVSAAILLADFAQGRTVLRFKEYSWIIYIIIYAVCYIGIMLWANTHYTGTITISFLALCIILCVIGAISIFYHILCRKQFKKYKGL